MRFTMKNGKRIYLPESNKDDMKHTHEDGTSHSHEGGDQPHHHHEDGTMHNHEGGDQPHTHDEETPRGSSSDDAGCVTVCEAPVDRAHPSRSAPRTNTETVRTCIPTH